MATTSPNQLVASEIRAWLGRKRITGRQLAAMIGASQTWTATRLRGEQEISVNDLARIAAALDVELHDLLPARTETKRRWISTSITNQPTHPQPSTPVSIGRSRPKLARPPLSSQLPDTLTNLKRSRQSAPSPDTVTTSPEGSITP